MPFDVRVSPREFVCTTGVVTQSKFLWPRHVASIAFVVCVCACACACVSVLSLPSGGVTYEILI
jgi:hypothetical protein